jgi:D-alanyl-D-alanine carboxypeptidase (penicillin-binding protein 5/6)
MLKRYLARVVFLVIVGLTSSVQTALGQAQTTPARAAIVIDMTSGAVLLDKNADTPIPPASMSKLMTLDLVFEALETGRLALGDSFRISERAAAMGGSKMFIRSGESVSIEDLLRGVIVQSGNDAAVALAEAISGTEAAFADLMNQRASAIGLTNSQFSNATGWPDPEHRMSPRDLATLAERIITLYPLHYAMFSETEFTWDGITQGNRNPLLSTGIGADGLKTGHTAEAGFGLVASAQRGERRILLVVSGLESAKQRRQESERLINWAFRAFETIRLYKTGEPVAMAEVWIGAAPEVAMAPERDLIVTVPYGMLDNALITAHFAEPVEAPIEAGVVLGRLEVVLPGVTPVSVPLVAVETVERGGVLPRLKALTRLLKQRLFVAGEG